MSLDPGRYLERIGYRDPRDGGPATLRALHRAHLFRVPFENLDIHLGRPLSLEEPDLYAKIVERRRGGFCYELNGLFAGLLRELGFDVDLLSARVADPAGSLGPEFDHMALLVRLEQRWLVDVGFGDSFRDPLLLDSRAAQLDGHAAYRLLDQGRDTLLLQRQDPDGAWQPQYAFTTRARRIHEFAGMCVHHQSSPDSHFTRKRMCTLATAEGRVTLSERTLIETVRGTRSEAVLADEKEWRAALRERFGIHLGETD